MTDEAQSARSLPAAVRARGEPSGEPSPAGPAGTVSSNKAYTQQAALLRGGPKDLNLTWRAGFRLGASHRH